MFQRFHENTQVSRFVKNLLSSEAIPLLQPVVEGMPLITGCRYLENGVPVLCKQSGTYGDTAKLSLPENTSRDISMTNFNSEVGWYDSKTHQKLGDYLRYIRDTQSLDLMKYYNCYNANELSDVYLNTAEIASLVCSNDVLDEISRVTYQVNVDFSGEYRLKLLYNKDYSSWSYLGTSVNGTDRVDLPLETPKSKTTWLSYETTVKLLRGTNALTLTSLSNTDIRLKSIELHIEQSLDGEPTDKAESVIFDSTDNIIEGASSSFQQDLLTKVLTLQYSSSVQNEFNQNNDSFYIVRTISTPPLYCGVLRKYDTTTTYKFGALSGYKVVAVPIKFDTTYTIAVDADNIVSLRGLIYGDNGMIQDITVNKKNSKSTVYYSDYLSYSCATLPYSHFREPFTYRVDLASNNVALDDSIKTALYTRQKDLKLILQIPSNSSSSIVVLEGDYTKNNQTEVTQGSVVFDRDPITGETIDSRELNKLYDTDTIPEDTCCLKHSDNLSLLYYNTGVSYAFSDRLIEYLLLNVVTQHENLSTNISRVQLSLKNIYPSYRSRLSSKESRLGVWDETIPKYIRSYIFDNRHKMDSPFDQDGYINKDVEQLLSSNGVYIT